MTILLISSLWFAALLLIVAMCRMAAQGDRATPSRVGLSGAGRSPSLLDTRAQWDDLKLSVEDHRLKRSPIRSKPSPAEYVGDRAQEDLYIRP
jgi:hypothetical protein